MTHKTVLITGGAGFIGSHLTKALVKQGKKVIVVDNFYPNYPSTIKKNNLKDLKNDSHFKLVKGDILDEKILAQAMSYQPQAVVHLAARAGVRESLYYPDAYFEVNALGTLKVWQAAIQHQVSHFILASSSSVYGSLTPAPFAEANQLDPQSPYALSKVAAEEISHFYAHQFQIPTTILRFFSVYGPHGRPDMAPYLFTKAMLQRKPITLFGDGTARRDFTYIDDIVAGILQALNQPFPFEIINLGNNQPIILNNLLSLIEKEVGWSPVVIHQPPVTGDVPLTHADITKAQKLLAWYPTTPFSTGIKTFVKWFRETHSVTETQLNRRP